MCTPPGFFQDNPLRLTQAFRFSLNFRRDRRAFHWLARELQSPFYRNYTLFPSLAGSDSRTRGQAGEVTLYAGVRTHIPMLYSDTLSEGEAPC